tara:strand:- start:335 stop:664 length:330 start_codon:yes stop_codon:yes gene_type:complete
MTTRNYKTEWNAKNKTLKAANDRDRHFKNKFGEAMMKQFGKDGQAGYEYLLEKQNHKCKLCGEKRELFHDHCHETGDIRGLICSRCNTAMGGYEFIVAMGENIIQEYLK